MIVLPPPNIFIYSRYEIVKFQGGVMIYFHSAGGEELCKVEILKDNEQVIVFIKNSIAEKFSIVIF